MDKKIFLIFIIILSFFVRVLYYYAQPDLSTDHLSQMAMTQNFMVGHGISFKYIDTDLNIYYKAHIQWPPLYPLILALLTFITSSALVSSLIIQISVLLLLIIIWKKIFNLFNNLVSEEAYFYFIILIIISTSVLNNINTILVVSLLILSLSLYFLFAYLFNESSKKINIFLSSLFASLLFWTHYSYFFVAFFPAITLITIYYLRKEKSYLIAGISSFLMSMTITSGVLLYNYINTGFINYMDNPAIWDAGFFPEHLLLTDPFFLNTFFKTAYLFDYLFKTDQYLFFNLFFQFISLIIFFLIIWLVLKLKKINTPSFDSILNILLPFSVIIVLTLSFLLYFTLHYHEIPRPGWTHIGDPRYMSAVYLSILAVVVIFLFFKAEYLNRKIINTVKSMLIFLIFINLLINIYITYKEWGNYTFKHNSYLVPNNDLQDLYNNIDLEISQGKIPVFIDNDLTVRSFRISQYAGAAVIKSNDLLKINKLSSDLVYFFIMPDENNYREKDNDLLKWASNFNLIDAGSVYNNLTLYKVTDR
jgi:hypothetical protein